MGTLTRRDFLVAANAAAALLALEACVPSFGKPSPAVSGAAGSTPEERALLLLQQAVRGSPDHLARRAEDLVKKKSSTGIVEFVRDGISVLPPWGENFDVRTARRWGSAATLRGGQGTMRERADILADLLTRAGFKAQVMAADRPSSLGLEQVYQVRGGKFAPDLQKVGQARAQLQQAGYPAPAAQHAFDPGADPVAAILGALPASAQKARVRGDLLPAKVPVVAFSEGAKTRYAFALGGLGISDSAPAGLGRASDADSLPSLSLTISALSNPPAGSQTPRGQLIDLVTGRWPLDQVAGRQVLLTFVPPEGPKALLEAHQSALPIRVPILRVQTDQPPAAAPANLTVVGSRVTVQGDVLGPAANGPSPSPGATVAGPYGAMKVLSDSDRKQAIARVAKLAAGANASAYPEVELTLTVSDGSGASVDGLDATSFLVKEEGAAVDGVAVFSNQQTRKLPRVLIVADAGLSGSWPSPAAQSDFATALAGAIAGLAASRPFETQVIALGASPDPGAWAAPQAAAISAALLAVREAADDPWATLGGSAVDQAVTAVVMVSDNDESDTDAVAGPALQRRLAGAGTPVFTIPVAPVDQPSTALILSLSGGARFDPADPATPAAVASRLAALLAAWAPGGYRLRYPAPAGGPTQRTVTVGLAGRDQPVATATYQVPSQPLPPPSFAGLYATISVAGIEVRRRLAGLELSGRGGPLGAIDDAVAVAETRAAIDGITTFAIEPGTPTSAAMLDDVLQSFLSVAPLVPLVGKSNADQLLAAARDIHRTPFFLPAVLRPEAVDAAGLPGLRVAIFQERALAADSIQEHVDLAVGLNPIVPVTSDPVAAFRAAVKTSVTACSAEAATFTDSAYHRLSGQRLVPILTGDLGARDAWLATVPPGRVQAWRNALRVYEDYHEVMPESGGAEAFWVVDPFSGASKAVLLDGTGGAIALVACKYDALDELALCVAELSVFCSLSPAGYSFYCVGINVLAVGISVALLFSPDRRDFGTPYGIALPFIGLGEAGFGGIEASIGIMLMLITIQKACS